MNNTSLMRRIFIGLIIGAILIVAGRYFSLTHRNTSSSDGEPYSTQALAPNRIYTATGLPTSTIAATNFPTLPITPTWTPLPTIQPSAVEALVESLYLECKLPCWGNIIPGETGELEAKHFLSSFGELDSTSTFFQYRGEPVIIDLTFKAGLVNSINLPPVITEFYQVDDLLTNYGIPGDIQIEIFPETAEGKTWFNLVLLYPQAGFFAIFSAEGKPVNSVIDVCPAGVSPDLYLVESNTYSLEQMNGFVSLILQQVLKPLESLTDIDKYQFYESFRTENNRCITTKVQTP